MKVRLRNILAVIFVGLLLVIAFSAATRSTQTSIKMVNYFQVPDIFSTGVSYGKQTMVASNGRSFVAYNYQTGKETLLSPDNLTSDLENIDKPLIVSSDQRYIAFHVSLAQAGSSLYAQLQNDKLDTTKGSWWLYDTEAKTFHPFPQTVVAVQFMGGNVYALTNTYGQQTIQTYNPATFTATQSVSAPSSSNLFATRSGGFWLQDGTNVLQTTDGTVSTTLFSNTTVLNVSSDGKSALLQNNNQYIFYALSTKKQTVIGSTKGGQVSWDQQNDMLFGKASSTSSSQSYTFFNATNQTTSSVDVYNQATKLVTVLDSQTALVSNGQNFFIVGKNVSVSQPVPNGYNKVLTIGSGYLNVQYYADQTAFIIVLNKPYAAAEQTAVYQQLQKDGYNPDLLEIRFTLFTPPTSYN